MTLEVSNSVLCSTLGQHQAAQGLVLGSFRYLQGVAAQPFWIPGPRLHWTQRKYFLFVSSGNSPCWMLIPSPQRGAWLCDSLHSHYGSAARNPPKPFFSLEWMNPAPSASPWVHPPNSWPLLWPLASPAQVALHDSLAFQQSGILIQTVPTPGKSPRDLLISRMEAQMAPWMGQHDAGLIFLFTDYLWPM